ncbi:MAG: M14 metallopeptidase family protein [Bacteroidota bacterium]
MRNAFLLCSFVLLTFLVSRAQAPIDYFLPEGTQYDATIQTPEQFLGYPTGKWHIGHDQLVFYMRYLAQQSDRVTLQEIGRTHEDRPLIVLTITHPDNHANLEAIRQQHVALSSLQSGNLDVSTMPSVVYQGYSIHGNEPSGTNAAPLVAYYLAAAKGEDVEQLLKDVVILMDPCLNPDGFNRFASWANTHKSKNRQADSETREHNEVWPGGRTNHYWFDLNRDWLLVAHPESQARIKIFHEWKPNILTDHHEMGTNSTYFFQPGVPARTNPLTPQRNQDLTGEIATYHVEALDQIGSLYYSEESFDDFYYGKGSTYPDANGCIGILFEQASSRGHVQESIHGDLTFEFTIRNQVKTSFSTLKAAQELRVKLLTYQKEFYELGQREATADPVKAYVFGEAIDQYRLNQFVDHLLQHDIDVYPLKKQINADGHTFQPGEAYVVPTNQVQYRLVKGIFQSFTTFKDSLFYDVSAWTLPMAYNLKFAELRSYEKPAESLETVPEAGKMVQLFPENYAYLIDWRAYKAPEFIDNLLAEGLVVKVAHESFTIATTEGRLDFPVGTMVIPAMNQSIMGEALANLLKSEAIRLQVPIYGVKTGSTPAGIDLGSPSASALRNPKALLLVGGGISAYEAGEVWHLLDKRFNIDLTVADIDNVGRMDLNEYATIIMVDGNFNSLNAQVEKIRSWTRNGGVIIAVKRSNRWLENKGISGVSFKNGRKRFGTRPYAERNRDSGAQVIGGAIFESKLDLTHPLAYGYTNAVIPVFRRGTLFFNPPKNPYAGPGSYTRDPLLSGYISDYNLKKLARSATIVVTRYGSGRVISLADNPNFRAYWYGTNRLFLNALFLGHTISSSACEMPSSPSGE